MPRIPSKILTYLLHPLLMPTYLYLVLMEFTPSYLRPINDKIYLQMGALILMCTFIMPIAGSLMFSLTGVIDSLSMEKKRDRILPLAVTVLFFGILTYLFQYKLRIGTFLTYMQLGMTISVFLTLVITLIWKISAHGVGIGGVTGLLFQLNWFLQEEALFYPFLLCLILSGALLSARLYLGSHSPLQVYAGWLLGVFVSLGLQLIDL